VYSAEGTRVGTVVHVLAAEHEDIFDGIVIGDLEHHLVGGHGHRFVDAPEVASIHERAVTLSIDAAACHELPQPSANPAEMDADPTDGPPSGMGGKLRRAWDMLSGNF
jgi:hypothetical protein